VSHNVAKLSQNVAPLRIFAPAGIEPSPATGMQQNAPHLQQIATPLKNSGSAPFGLPLGNRIRKR
jgi:hypothetical protein